MLKNSMFDISGASSADALGFSRDTVVLCFSHLRWDFVFQRPQHIMSRLAKSAPVHVWEEAVFEDHASAPSLEVGACQQSGVTVVKPILPSGLAAQDVTAHLRQLLDAYVEGLMASHLVRWYYTPMMLPFSEHLAASCTVYDCMDELANFRFAPARLLEFEGELFERADLVFTGGYSLYEAKREHHPSVHPFPSSVDIAHLAQARAIPTENTVPTFGFYGVLDERFDIDLLAAIADARPGWRFVMVGPVVKISPDDLPKRDNILYPGAASYDDLPGLLAEWDVALMPFAINDATKFISPTKTPEYLAAGKPVVSTPVRDVVRHYGRLEGVKIAATPDEFVAGCKAALKLAHSKGDWLAEVDQALSAMSWNTTQARMAGLIAEVVDQGALAGAVA